jgi:sugar lactone lactonase YvrE
VPGVLLALVARCAGGPGDARGVRVAPIDRELDGPGRNVDDACFWLDERNPAASLLFVTTKDSGLVEVFSPVTGALVTTITGFGRPNNCAVEGNLLVTTDREPEAAGAAPGGVKVHRIPDFTLVRAFAGDTVAPHGVDVLTLPSGEKRVYVTDSADASVRVYDLASGRAVATFATGFGGGIEPVLGDDHHGRLFVARGEKEDVRGVGVFDYEGRLLREFGAEVLGKDAEGMAVYACGSGGYLVIADQHKKRTQFEVFDRVTLDHRVTFYLEDGKGDFTNATDGIEIVQDPLPGFPSGFLAACDGCGTDEPDEMDVVSWDRIASTAGLERCPGGVATSAARGGGPYVVPAAGLPVPGGWPFGETALNASRVGHLTR